MSNVCKGLFFTITTILISMDFGGSGLVYGQTEVHVEAMDHAFDVDAPNELPSGWVTFYFSNLIANNTHEISLVRLPDGVAHEEYLTDYMTAWETLLWEYQEGVVERSGISDRVNEMLPGWAGGTLYPTTRGLTSPGKISERTVFLEPAKYMMVCWMKTEDGIIHIMEGMHWEFTITEDTANNPEPNPESRITLHEDDIEQDWEPEIGKHTFALEFSLNPDGQPFHNNIHLVRMEEGTDLDEVNDWLDWYRIGGLRSVPPVEFVGGVEVMKDGATAYFALNITEPGDYAWVVFVPRGQGVYKRFTIE
ncbi:MAG: hypothetical protein WD016_14140 [Balneolaceae bacterium]